MGLKGKKRKIVAKLAPFMLFTAMLTACGTPSSSSTTQPGTSNGTGTTSSEVVRTEAEKFAERVGIDVSSLQAAGNYTFYDTKATSTTLLNGNGEAEVRKNGKTEYYFVEGAKTYNVFRNENGQWQRRDSDDFAIPDWSGYKVEELTGTTAKLVKGQTELVASYVDNKLVVDLAAGQQMEIYNIGKTSLTIPQYVVPQTKDEKIAAFAAELNKLKTPNFTISETINNKNHTYLVATDAVKADNDYYTTENGTGYRYYFDATANTWYREEGTLAKNFNYTSVSVEDLNENTNEYAVKLNNTAYTAFKDGDSISIYNTTGSWLYSDLGTTNVNVPTNWQERTPVESNLIVENGVYSVKLMKEVLTDWIENDNQFGKSVVLAKLRNGINLGEIYVVNVENGGLACYMTTSSTVGTHLRKMYFTNDALNSAIANQTATTSDQMLTLLKNVQGTEIEFDKIIECDTTVSQDVVNARTEMACGNNFWWAMETKGAKSNWDRDWAWTTVKFDTDNHLKVINIILPGASGKDAMFDEGQNFTVSEIMDIQCIDNTGLYEASDL